MSFMTMSTFGLPISVSDADTEITIARKAGWRRADLSWERLQEQGNAALLAGDTQEAVRCFRRAAWISRWRFRTPDPRCAAPLADLALADRLIGREARYVSEEEASTRLHDRYNPTVREAARECGARLLDFAADSDLQSVADDRRYQDQMSILDERGFEKGLHDLEAILVRGLRPNDSDASSLPLESNPSQAEARLGPPIEGATR